MTDKDRDFQDALVDIAEHLEAAIDFVSGYADYDAFTADKMATFAVVRALEVAGEAARKVPMEFRDKNPQVPWREMVGMRDRLIHGYDRIHLPIVWATINEDVPGALEEIRRILRLG